MKKEIENKKTLGGGELYDAVSKLSEMTENDHLFLYNLIAEFRPHKILELGVAEGGTDVIILDWLSKEGLGNTEFFAIDLAEYIGEKKIGYLVSEWKDYLSNYEKYHLYTGHVVGELIEKICEDEKCDFCIIDTTHIMPGEVLDLLAVLPFLKENGIIVLHDVMLHHMSKNRCYATQIAFDCIVGNKIWNWDSEKYPNIAAVQINGDTYKYSLNLISVLGIPWQYNPGHKIIESYAKIIKKFYDDESYSLFRKNINLNLEWIQGNKFYFEKTIVEIINMISSNNVQRVFLYGAGKGMKRYLHILIKYNMKNLVYGILISDDQKRVEDYIEGIKVYKWSEINYNKNTDVIINTVGEVEKFLIEYEAAFIPVGTLLREQAYCLLGGLEKNGDI